MFRTVRMVEGVEDIEQNVGILLRTSPGERTMLPDFGCPFQEFVFAGINPVTVSQLQDAVRRAIVNYEPRIDLETVEVQATTATPDELRVLIGYTIRSTNSRHSFVHPFVIAEGTGLDR